MNKTYRRMRPLLGTFVEIAIATDAGDEFANRSISASFETVEKVQRLLSFHHPNSDLSRLNASQGEEVTLDPLSSVALSLAKWMTKKSGGLFDCTIGGKLVNLGYLPNLTGGIPCDFGEPENIKLCGRKARLNGNLRITLDGIAKGYAVDLGVRRLKCAGVASGYINAGGDLMVFGELQLSLERREIDGRLRNLGNFSNIAIATSKTGLKYQAQFPSVILSKKQDLLEDDIWTVSANSAWRADSLTKVACLLPAEQRETSLLKLGGALVQKVGAWNI